MNGLTEYQLEFMSQLQFAVLTVREAAIAFDRDPSTIRYQIKRNNIAWRKTVDGVYLVMRESLIAYYGTRDIRQGFQVQECSKDYVLREKSIVSIDTTKRP